MHGITIVQEEETPADLFKSQELTLKKNYRAHKYRIVSITYAVFTCLFGIVLSTIEPFKACKLAVQNANMISRCSLRYSLYLCMIAKQQQKIAIKHPTGYNRRVSTNFKSSQFAGFKFLDTFLNKDFLKLIQKNSSRKHTLANFDFLIIFSLIIDKKNHNLHLDQYIHKNEKPNFGLFITPWSN
ncbi:hypothetical protein BpHYR1_018956 [Brachionus plicatilis]|uniref:Transmembrane protein n=1 Tax=Brachionus plicatilis TaxID=10195 RepID=A0A3M7QMP2_BRAPC|nr:hypothetical protein BpHYR1_018956 [Brachionus plicatilis]